MYQNLRAFLSLILVCGAIIFIDSCSGEKALIKTYNSVTFNSNNGSTVEAQNIDIGSKVKKPADPTKLSYAFGGWYQDESLMKAFDFETEVVTTSITLYAKWIATYKVSFESNGGSRVDTLTVNVGSKINAPTNPNKSGSSFGGWYKDASQTIAFNFSTEVITSDITLYAKWTATGYQVTFQSNGGSAIRSKEIAVGEKIVKPTDPYKSGYVLEGDGIKMLPRR